MKWGKKLIGLSVAVIFGLSLILIPAGSQVSPVQAAVTWTKSTTAVTLEGEKYVGDAWVIKDGDTYKMWYTHGKSDLSSLGIVHGITAAFPDTIIGKIASLAVAGFMGDLSNVNLSETSALLDGMSTVIGYATSTDGVTWTKVNDEVLAGPAEGAWFSVGNPCVIKDGDTLRMWYTHLVTDLDQTDLTDILTKLGEDGERKGALINLLDTTSTVINYATSTDGIIWTPENDGEAVLAGTSGGVGDSVADPCVIKDGTTYKMWYTQGKSDVTRDTYDTLDAATFSIADLLGILDGSSTVISYTTSSTGIDWATPQEAHSGGDSAWNSVADPSVVKDSSYEMWYTQGTTDLDRNELHALLLAAAALASDFWDILDAFEAGDFETLLTNISALDSSTIEGLLDDTHTTIGYATSTLGTTDWSVYSTQDLVGSSSSAWSSVAAPSVVKEGLTYHMWYTEGIEDFVLSDLLALVLGTDLPIGYATYAPVEELEGAPSALAAPPAYIETTLFGIEADFDISDEGEIEETIEATSEDGMLTITIPEGTIALDKDGDPLEGLEAAVDETPPAPPEDAHIIGLAYDFGPDGATFDPPITLEYTYDPADIPEGPEGVVAEEDLVLAYYDEEAGEWVELDCVVDTENNTITASVEHFTIFAIIGTVAPPPPVPAPAAFSVTNLSVKPAEVQPKEVVTITVSVANTGGTEGSYTVVLKINEVKEAEKSVTIAAGGSEIVTFSVTKAEAGSYGVVVDGLSTSFTVVAPPVAPPLKPPVVPPVKPINWWVIGGIIAGVIIIGIVTWQVIVRRRA